MHNVLIYLLLWVGLVTFVAATEPGSHAGQKNDPKYVGTATCATCHVDEYRLWQGSHHDLAMQPATAENILGDFSNASFQYNGITSTFYKKADEFWVNTDGADGQLTDYRIDYAFGVSPLQQYLVGFDDGRYQALNIAWDTRPESQGGQRWFHLYPGEKVDSSSVLHWTRFSHNWNARCAKCHSTNLQKNYQPESNSYNTSWFEIDVACESCHGPGAGHIEWLNSPAENIGNKGLSRDLSAAAKWRRLPGMSTASSTGQSQVSQQINHCADCHSRRGTIHSFSSKEPFTDEILDRNLLSFIESPLYYVDGQIQDEVYVYGSFIQSRMHQRGVVCSNCHDPHSLQLKAEGNQLCAQCHNASQYDTPGHHHHGDASSGARCVNCHMPETSYMVVDPRRDHRLGIPRPDLTEQLGVPNACNQCHRDRSVEWALEGFRQWYPRRQQSPHFAHVLHGAQTGVAQALPQLVALSNDSIQSVLVRASALQLVANFPNQYAINAALNQLQSKHALIRLAALRALNMMPMQQRMSHLWPLLDDPVKAVRLEATRLLAGVGLQDGEQIPVDQKQQLKLDHAIEQYLQAAMSNADTPGGQMQLGLMYLAIDRPQKAEMAYRHALIIEPDYIPAMLNLADLFRLQGKDSQAEPLLLRALSADRHNAVANYAMGLLKIRLQQLGQAVVYLEIAAAAAPEVVRYGYVYAVALYENGKPESAVTMLRKVLQQHPADQQVLSALAAYLQALGRAEEAQQYNRQLKRQPRQGR